MKRAYVKPQAEIEVYKLDAAIALNCGNPVSIGPESFTKDPCAEFDKGFGGWSLRSTLDPVPPGNTPFYDDGDANCDCYYTSGNMGYFTS